MGEKSGVSWTDSSHNFWYGCRKVSQGCKFCYAERQMSGYGRDFHKVTRSKSFDKPLHWQKGRRIFVNPWSDFFIEEADEWRDDAWDVIRQTPQHTHVILTKRPENIDIRLPMDWGRGWPNVWLGVSAEDQDQVDSRIPVLLSIPAVIRFASIEPMLGMIDIECLFAFTYYEEDRGSKVYPGLDWVIAGGESGPHQANPKTARPLDMEWVRSLRDQCDEACVPFWFKQDSDVRPEQRAYVVEEDGSHTVWQQAPEREDLKPKQQTLF